MCGTSPDLSQAVAAQTMDLWGRLDMVVANAGIASWPPTTWEATDDQWDVMLDVSLTGDAGTRSGRRCPPSARAVEAEPS